MTMLNFRLPYIREVVHDYLNNIEAFKDTPVCEAGDDSPNVHLSSSGSGEVATLSFKCGKLLVLEKKKKPDNPIGKQA